MAAAAVATTNKVALITGAGTGIGKAATLALYEAGFSIVLAGRRREPLEETASGLASDRFLIVPTNVTQPDQVRDLFTQTKHRFGHLDILFNNAGIGSPPVPFEDIALEDFRNVMETCVTGTFLCTQQAFQIMKAQEGGGGRIINNGSISAHTPRPNSAPYTAAKHAITGLTKSTNLDGREFWISCSQIDIGNAATNMTERMSQGVLQANGQVAVEPTMDVDQVGKAVVYLATLPLDANVPFMTIMATQMPYIGRG